MTIQRRVFIGFSLALSVLLTAGASLLVLHVPFLRARPPVSIAGVAILGLLLLIWARAFGRHEETVPMKITNRAEIREEHPLGFFGRASYWGWMLFLCAGPMLLLTERFCRPLVVAAKELPAGRPAAR